MSQTVELDPRLAQALTECHTKNVPIHYDGTCRASLLEPLGAKPLGIAFDRVEHDPHTLQDDTAYIRFQRYFLDHAARLKEKLGESVPPVVRCENPEVLFSECAHGDARVLWAINNTLMGLDPALMWRVGLTITNRLPVVEQVRWDIGEGYKVRNLMTGEAVDVSQPLTVDLRTFPACAFVAVKGRDPSELLGGSRKNLVERPRIGSHLRDLAVSGDGQNALVSAANWDQNLFDVDLKDGTIRWRTKVGHHFAYDPRATSAGFTVRGFDLLAPEGYHLYQMGDNGGFERRFALYGLPKKATSWANTKQHTDPIDNFAVSPDGGWVATAGDLGLAVWSRDGARLWSDDWWKKNARKRVFLLAPDAQTLVTMSGSRVTAHAPKDGKVLWQHRLGETGTIQGGVASADGRTIVLASTAEGGRLFVLRDGRPINSLPTPSIEVAVSPDGRWIASTDGETLKLFDANGGLRWSMIGNDVLRYPCFAPDGRRLAVGSELGTLSVLDVEGHLLHEQDAGSLPVARWMPGGELVVATWLGRLFRLNSDYGTAWSTVLTPEVELSRERFLARDETATTRIDDWGNAAPKPAPLTPNLLAQTDAIIRPVHDPPAHGERHWQNDIKELRDGEPTLPEKPWLSWSDVGMIDSGWRERLTLEIDTFRTQIRLTGITIVEDPAHRESWQRDLRLQSWNPKTESWLDGPYLLSNRARHTHWFEEPIEAARFRFVTTGGGVWPYNNLRWGELVFHGEVLGASHPDVVAQRPIAVLFDEQESDLKCLMAYGGRPFAFKYDDAASGGKSLALTKAGNTAPSYQVPFGHTVPNWDFAIVDNPKHGQYRYMEFSWKTLSKETKGITLHVGPAQAGHLALVAGEPSNFHVGKTMRLAAEPPQVWTTVRIDLWKEWGRNFQLRSLSIAAEGGGAAFDNIRLARSPKDFEPSE